MFNQISRLLFKRSITFFIFYLAVSLVSNNVNAQTTHSFKATYQSKLTFIETMNDSIKKSMIEKMGVQMFNAYFDAMKNAGESEFTLNLSDNKSLFERNLTLQKPTPKGNVTIDIQSSSPLVKSVFKDMDDNYQLTIDNIFGKVFLVEDSLVTYNWNLTKETKKIGKYSVFKAILKVDNEKKTQENSLLSLIEDSDTIITAWFAPEIPFSNGPGPFHGLPGLILAIDDGTTTLVCKEIEFLDQEIEIVKPTTGKKISLKDFIVLKDFKLRERRNRN